MLGQIGRAPFAVPLGQATGEEATPNATSSAAGLMSAADKIRLDNMAASWSLSAVRYYLLDYDGGSDTNTGYVDATAGTTLTPGGLALKTHERLFQILPTIGAGRACVILTKNRAAGATYLKQDGVTAEDVDWSEFANAGYRFFQVRGSSDLTNDTTDRVKAGFITAITGPGGSGQWTAAAGATTTAIPLGSGTLTTDQAVGFRVRVLTGALAGTCGGVIVANTSGTGTITLGGTLGGTLSNGDTFMIEKEGVRVNTLVWVGRLQSRQADGGFVGPALVGYGAAKASGSGQFVISQDNLTICGCGIPGAPVASNSIFLNACARVSLAPSYTDETGNSRTLGVSLRTTGGYSFTQCQALAISAAGFLGSSASFATLSDIGSGTIGGSASANYHGARASISGCGTPGIDRGIASALFVVGAGAASTVKSRSVGGFSFQRSRVAFDGLTFESCSSPCIGVGSGNNYGSLLVVDGCSGSSGNTSVGIDLSSCRGVTAYLGITAANTVTGTAGDVKLEGSAIAAHTTFTTTNVNDSVGNSVVGTGGVVVGPGRRYTNVDGSALAVGEVVRLSAAGQVVRAAADTSAHADGPLFVAVTPPANNTAGYFVELASPKKWVLFDAAAPAVNSLAYLSPGTGGSATVTVPAPAATNQKRRIGHVAESSGSLGLVTGSPELLTVTSDGVAP
jgi:hypothetical protein